MVFEPISGTIGATALLDPALKGASWVYAKHRLGRNFGENFEILTIKYRSEVARFAAIRDQNVYSLSDSPLNESRTSLNDVFRQRLLLELNAFEECEKLIEKYDKRVSRDSDVAQQAIGMVQSPDTKTDSTVPSSAASQNRLNADAALSSFSSRLSRKFGKKKERVAAQRVQTSSAGLQDDRLRLEEGYRERQAQSTFGERRNWAIKDCDRFKQLVQELIGHNDYFTSIIKLQPPKHNEHHIPPEDSAQIAHVTSHLRRLIRSLAATRESNNIFFRMMLHDNPFDFHSRINSCLPATALLRPSSSIFAFQLKKASSGTQAPYQNDNAALLFEVPSSYEPLQDVDQQIEDERPRIESFAWEFIPAESLDADSEDPDRKLWWAAIGTINDVVGPPQPSETNRPIAVFHDRTTYTLSKTLRQSFTDPTESKLMENKCLASRVHLAYILASSFMYFVSAGYPLDYSSKSLHYYSDSETNPQLVDTLQLAQKRKNPYIQLRAVGSSQFPESFSLILANAIETASNAQIMVQKLGVLLFEVGVWKPVSSAEDWRSLSAAARNRKDELLKCATTEYFDVVHACLEFAAGKTWTTDDQVAWLSSNVVQPLRRVLGNLPLDFSR